MYDILKNTGYVLYNYIIYICTWKIIIHLIYIVHFGLVIEHEVCTEFAFKQIASRTQYGLELIAVDCESLAEDRFNRQKS